MSSDDTSVAILEKHSEQSTSARNGLAATLHFHENVTSDNSKFAGVHPMIGRSFRGSFHSFRNVLWATTRDMFCEFVLTQMGNTDYPSTIGGSLQALLPIVLDCSLSYCSRDCLVTRCLLKRGILTASSWAAQDSHQRNLAALIAKALPGLPKAPQSHSGTNHGIQIGAHGAIGAVQDLAIPVCSNGRYMLRHKPDFISVTRGPGLRSCLATGVDTAKGLSVAWQIPLLGVNHMQAHALTPRLVSALKHSANRNPAPAFPFLSLLVSGGHTLLVLSKSITDHEKLAQTNDIAIGDCLDKIARAILPTSVITQSKDTMYGRLLESFAFPLGPRSYNYTSPARRHEEFACKRTKWGWSLGTPLAETRPGKSRNMEFTFTGTQSNVQRICESRGLKTDGDNVEEERVGLARESMRVLFEHLVRIFGALPAAFVLSLE